MRKRYIILIIPLICSAYGWAYFDSYGPFEEDSALPLFSIQKCPLTHYLDPNEHPDQVDCCYEDKTDRNLPIVRIRYFPQLEAVLGWLSDDAFQSISKPSVLVDFFTRYFHVYHADLNKDGKEDFVIISWYAGCGHAASGANVTFFLSTSESYSAVTVSTSNPGPHCFIQLPENKGPVYIHSSMIYSDEGKDAKPHNYWVYNLYEFRNGQLVLCNDKDPRFSKWVWYTFNPNHKETTLLTQQQKEQLWKEHQNKYFFRLDPSKEELRDHFIKQNREVFNGPPKQISELSPPPICNP